MTESKPVKMPWLNRPGMSTFKNLLTAPLAIPAVVVGGLFIGCYLFAPTEGPEARARRAQLEAEKKN